MKTLFERAYVINLERRTDRLESFFANLPQDWPFPYPRCYTAVDGDLSPPPRWWKATHGAWGCYKTHLNIIEKCLNLGIDSVLIMEDDAVCVDHFREKAERFCSHLPNDWEMLYFGGQHIQENQRLPRKVNEWVYRPYNVNRMHCYALRGRKIMESVYRHFHDFSSWSVAHHVDHHLGELQKTMESGLYVPREWLTAQARGESNISDNDQDYRLFCGAEELINPKIDQTGIAVLGNWFGGTNLTAGVLFMLGLNLGNNMKPKQSSESPAMFEDARLREICKYSYEEQWLTEKLQYEDRVNHLKRWAGLQCQDENRFFCGKHPLLSLMCRELSEAWNHPLFISVERSADDCVHEMLQSKEPWNPETLQRAIFIADQQREEYFVKYQPRLLRIAYHRLKTQPEEEIARICQFLDWTPLPDNIKKAKAMIRASQDELSVVIP
jgi:hypothetical protein